MRAWRWLSPGTNPAPIIEAIFTPSPQIGFVLDPLEVPWNRWYEQLRRFNEVNGRETDVSPNDPEWPGLRRWCGTQARDDPFPTRQLTEPGWFCTWNVLHPKKISTGKA